MLTRDEHRVLEEPPRLPGSARSDDFRMAAWLYATRVRRLKLRVASWGLWTILITTLWVAHEWDVNGAFERFGHEGDPGQWNPTLWALGIGVPTLIVGIMALSVYFERPSADLTRLRSQWLKFHVAAWLFGMVVLTPLWALIEWQDNGGFERWSNNSRPGEWDPWILIVGGVWALAVLGLFAVRQVLERPTDAR
jgi:uncharacterized membrane protein YphA (DoxX/SURF4 family)